MHRLQRTISKLSHLSLEGQIGDKQAHASGLGGSCDVFYAWSQKHNKAVAIKRIRAFLTEEPSLAKRLAKELRIWAKLDHPNVLPLLGFIIEGENAMPSLISEWMRKGTLYIFMKEFPKCSGETLYMLHGISVGLAYLHSKGVIHADLKSVSTA